MKRVWAAVVIVLFAGGMASCSTDPETAKREYFAQGERHLAAKEYAEAILQFRNAVRIDDRFGEARAKLAEAYLGAGDSQSGLRETIRAADLMPDNMEAQMRAGILLLIARQFPDARARATKVLAKEPRNPRALVLLGNALAGLKDLDSAVELVEQAIDEDPQLTLSYANLGALQAAKGDQEAAEAALRRAVEIAPDSESAHTALANFLWSAGRPDEAARELEASFQIAPRSPLVNQALAGLRISQNRVPEVEPYLKTYAAVSGTIDSRLLLADYYLRTDKASMATPILTEIAKEPQGFIPATVRLARIDFSGGRRPEAYGRLEAILKRQPTNEVGLESKARFLLAEQKGQEALGVALSLVEGNPKSIRGHYVRGLALEATGASDQAISAFQEVLRLAPSSPPAQQKLATLHLARGNFKEALSFSQQFAKTQPRSVAAQLLYAQAMLRSGNIAGAESQLLVLAKAAPSSADIHAWLGMTYEAKRDVRNARRSFQRALELEPQSTVALAGLVSADLADKNPTAALGRIEKQLSQTPSDPRLILLSGMAYASVRDFPKAEAAYRKFLDLNPNSPEAYARLGGLYLAQNRLDEARRSFEDLARRQAKPVAAETMIGTILLTQNKTAEARKHFERALQLDPRAAVAANNLAYDYANTGGNLDVALQLAQTAKAELPDHPLVTGTLGFVYYKKGLSSIAVTTLREASKQSPSNTDIQYHLGLAYLQNGNKVEARSTLQQVLKMKPGAQTADEVRRVLATIQG